MADGKFPHPSVDQVEADAKDDVDPERDKDKTHVVIDQTKLFDGEAGSQPGGEKDEKHAARRRMLQPACHTFCTAGRPSSP